MTISIRLDTNLEQRFLQKLRKLKRSKSEVVRELIHDFLDSEEQEKSTAWDIFEATLTPDARDTKPKKMPSFKSKSEMKNAFREKVSQKFSKKASHDTH